MRICQGRALVSARVSFSVAAVASLLAAACMGGVQVRSAPADVTLSCLRATDASGSALDAAVSWITDAASRTTLDAWCTGVGPVVLAPIPTPQVLSPGPQAPSPRPQAPGPRPQAPVAVVTWNVNVGAGDLSALVRDLRAGRFSDGRPVNDFVLLVQEALRTGPAVPPIGAARAGARRLVRVPRPIDIVRFAHEAGLSLFYVPSMRNGMADDEPAEDRGNAILSTLPLSELRAVELPFARQRRIAAVATLGGVGPAGALTVASVHLDPFVSARRLWFLGAPGIRGRQARAVAAALPATGPLVVGGDFNTWAGAGEPAVAEMMRVTGPAPLKRQGTFSNGLVLDYLFFRAASPHRSGYERADIPYGSDHYPLIGWLAE